MLMRNMLSSCSWIFLQHPYQAVVWLQSTTVTKSRKRYRNRPWHLWKKFVTAAFRHVLSFEILLGWDVLLFFGIYLFFNKEKMGHWIRTLRYEGATQKAWQHCKQLREIGGPGLHLFKTSFEPLSNLKAVPGWMFWPREFVFLSVQRSGFNSLTLFRDSLISKVPKNKVTKFATTTSSRGQVLTEASNPASGLSNKDQLIF